MLSQPHSSYGKGVLGSSHTDFVTATCQHWPLQFLQFPPPGVPHRFLRISCASRMTPGHQSAFLYQVSVPSGRVCVVQVHQFVSHVLSLWMRLSSSRLQVVSCFPRCVPVQTSAIRHDELRKLILPCNQTFQGPFHRCGSCGFLRCRCDTFWSEQVQLWDDKHLLKKICRNVAWVRLPGRSTDILQQSVVVSLLFRDSSHGLNNICPSLVHDNALNCSYSNTHEHTSRPPPPTCVENDYGSRRTHQSSATQLSKPCPSNACRLL